MSAAADTDGSGDLSLDEVAEFLEQHGIMDPERGQRRLRNCSIPTTRMGMGAWAWWSSRR